MKLVGVVKFRLRDPSHLHDDDACATPRLVLLPQAAAAGRTPFCPLQPFRIISSFFSCCNIQPLLQLSYRCRRRCFAKSRAKGKELLWGIFKKKKRKGKGEKGKTNKNMAVSPQSIYKETLMRTSSLSCWHVLPRPKGDLPNFVQFQQKLLHYTFYLFLFFYTALLCT